jgi:hypothetical protein
MLPYIICAGCPLPLLSAFTSKRFAPPQFKLFTNRLSDRIMLRRRFAALWRHADFMRLWTGQTISGFGSLIGATAIGFTAIGVETIHSGLRR